MILIEDVIWREVEGSNVSMNLLARQDAVQASGGEMITQPVEYVEHIQGCRYVNSDGRTETVIGLREKAREVIGIMEGSCCSMSREIGRQAKEIGIYVRAIDALEEQLKENATELSVVRAQLQTRKIAEASLTFWDRVRIMFYGQPDVIIAERRDKLENQSES